MRKLASSTIQKYTIELSLFFRFLSSNNINSIKDVNANTIRKYLSQVRKNKFWLTKRTRTIHTIAYKITMLHSFFEFLYQRRCIARNPVKDVPRPLVPIKLPPYLSFDQAVKLLKYVIKNKKRPHQYQIRARAYISLILFYGLENHEIFKIKVRDINFKRRIIRIRESSFHDKRVLPLFEPATSWLKAYKRIRPVRKSAIFFQNVKSRTDFGAFTSRGVT
jgi:site-specific recombinase XerD